MAYPGALCVLLGRREAVGRNIFEKFVEIMIKIILTGIKR
jgi:hypothetical protein